MIHVPDYKLQPEEANTYCICESCGCDIYEGEDYYYIDEVDVCDSCIWDYVRQFKKIAE